MPKVSLTVRILAWFVVLSLGAAAVIAIHHLIVGDRTGLPTTWVEAALGIFGFLLLYPITVYIALTGRPPKWWKSIDDFADITKPSKFGAKENRNE